MKQFKYVPVLMCLLFLPLQASQISKGIFFSAGIGVALSHTDFKTLDEKWSSTASETHVGAAASFKLGYGVNDALDVYVTRTSAFVHGYEHDTKNRTFGNCITALGVNYYPEPTSPWYLMAAVGQGQLSDISEDDSKAQKGWGYLVGAGYELNEYIHLEASFMETRVDDAITLQSDVLHVALAFYLY